MIIKEANKLRIYACGGAGINIGRQIEQNKNQAEGKGFAYVDVCYADASKSNIGDEAENNKDFFLVNEDHKGSGKIRKANYDPIVESTADLLHKHPPQEINVVLMSISGGTGSVIGPSVASALLDRNQNVIVIAVGSTDSRVEIENSIKTLKSFEGVAKLRKKPLVMAFYENNKKHNRASVNESVQRDIVMLSMLFSGQNEELDSADLANWLDYTETTSIAPKTIVMDIVQGELPDDIARVISVATLSTKSMNPDLNTCVEYRCNGFVSDMAGNVPMEAPVHFILVDGLASETYKSFEMALKSFKEAATAARRSTAPLLDDGDVVQSDGLVL